MIAALVFSAGAPSLIAHAGTIGLLTLLPLLAIAATSFTKMVVVLGLLRAALGAANVPPAAVVTAVAAALSLLVMAPVAQEVAERLQPQLAELERSPQDGLGFDTAGAIYKTAAPPLLRFLADNAHEEEVAFFGSFADSTAANEEAGLSVLLPAFVTSELTEAFIIGLLIFIPFLVVDLIVSNVLLAIGLQTVSPAIVALPLKLLLFTAADGWHTLLGGLLSTYLT